MKSSYRDCSDEELIVRLREGEKDITDYIMEKYKGMVKTKAKTMFLLGGEGDDLIQEGMIGLFKAIRDYDSGRDASFATFADLCVSRQMYTAVQASSRKKHMPLNTYISLYAGTQEGADEKEAELMNALPADSGMGPEEMMIDRENTEVLEQVIERELSVFEKQVLDLHLTGMGYVEIARILGKDTKSTDNALQRIRSKLKKSLRTT